MIPITITIEKPPMNEFVGIALNSEIINFVLKKLNTNNNATKMYILIVLLIIKILNLVQFLPFQ